MPDSLEVLWGRLAEKVESNHDKLVAAVNGLGERVTLQIQGLGQEMRHGDKEVMQSVVGVQSELTRHIRDNGHAEIEAKMVVLEREIGAVRGELAAWKNRAVGIGIGATLASGGIAGALVKLLS